ncbi:MAG: amidohydrolase family protein [Thaumarchaeota archaeon]|nr:amidohydrolase family protein [Candidatus Geocrenenecus arthurdayi]
MRVVDFHVHPIPRIISEKELLREVEHAGVDLAVLLALDVDPHHLEDKHTLIKFLEECINYSNWNCLGCLEIIKDILQTCFTSNEYIAKLVKNNPKKFIGVGSINPSKKMSYVKEKLREIDKLSMAGVKLIPTLQFFNPLKEKSKLERIFEFCEDKQKIIIFHTGCDPAIWEEPSFSQNANPAMLKYYASKFKKVPIILAHMGSYSRRYPGIWFDEAVELGKKYSNVWFDISAVPYLLTEKKYVDKISRELGWDRVLFGSDYPVVGSSSIVSMLNIIRDSSLLSENNLEKVLYQNALKLLGL